MVLLTTHDERFPIHFQRMFRQYCVFHTRFLAKFLVILRKPPGNLTEAKKAADAQQQRVAIARALSNRPKLLPTAALDSIRGRKVMELFQKVAHTQDTSVIVVTHDQRSLDVFDRILLMEDGRLRQVEEN